MLIGIAGKAGAGKDTLAKHISHTYDYPIVHLADPIKAMLNTAFGWSISNWDRREWKELKQGRLGFSPREAAQKLGTEWRDSLGNTMLWCTILDNNWSDADDIVVPDIRFPHEQDWIHSHRGIVIHILRPENSITVTPHSSETSLDLAKVDYTIYNHESHQEAMFKDFDKIYEEVLNERKLKE